MTLTGQGLWKQYRKIFKNAAEQAISVGGGCENIPVVQWYSDYEVFNRDHPTLNDKKKLVAETKTTSGLVAEGMMDALILLENKGIIPFLDIDLRQG